MKKKKSFVIITIFVSRLMFRKVTSSAVFETIYIHHLLEGKLCAIFPELLTRLNNIWEFFQIVTLHFYILLQASTLHICLFTIITKTARFSFLRPTITFSTTIRFLQTQSHHPKLKVEAIYPEPLVFWFNSPALMFLAEVVDTLLSTRRTRPTPVVDFAENSKTSPMPKEHTT